MGNDFSRSLCHYGILGQKWGIRRFQPYPKDYKGDGKIVGEAAKAAKRERHNVISKATLAGINVKSTKKQYAKAVKNRIVKGGEQAKADVRSARENYQYWQKQYAAAAKEAKVTVRKLQKQYGDTLIRDIPYKDGIIKGQVFTKKQLAARGAITVVSLVGGPFLPGLGAETALLAAPLKSTAALSYKVKNQREAGIAPRGKIEKGLNFAQVQGEKLVEKAKEKLKRKGGK